MPRSITIADHLSLAELKDRYKKSRDPVESRRYHLVWLVKEGYSLQEAAQIIGFTYDYAQKVINGYNRSGEQALRNRVKDNKGSGRPTLLTPDQQAALQELIKTPPDGGGSWSGPKVAAWISQQIGRDVSPQRGWDYLKRMGYPLEWGGDRRSAAVTQRSATQTDESHPRG